MTSFVKLSAADEARLVERIVEGVVQRLRPALGLATPSSLDDDGLTSAELDAEIKALRAARRDHWRRQDSEEKARIARERAAARKPSR